MTMRIGVIIVLPLTLTHMYTQAHTYSGYEGKQIHPSFRVINSRSLLILNGIYGLKQF